MPKENDYQLSHLGFQRIEPCNALRDFVDCYWLIDTTCTKSGGYHEYLHPNGSFGFVYNYGDTLIFNGKEEASRVYLDGTNTLSMELELKGRINALGVRFKPAGVSLFLKTPLPELKNQQVSLHDIQLNQLSNLYQQLPETKGLRRQVALIENTLIKCRLNNKQVSSLIYRALDRFDASLGMLPIATLAVQLNLEQRNLERLFNSHLGMTPIEYGKLVRINIARKCLKDKRIPLVDIAHRLGFFDQAHFNKSFKSVVGIAPGKYRQRV